MASTDLTVNIIGNAKSAVDAFDQTGDAAERNAGKFDKLKAGITVASAVAVAAVAKFAGDSIAAYSEAEQSQAALTAAYEKFPAVSSVTIDALRNLNSEIQKKTGYDDDQLAASQATLAQFGLTGEQIQQLTPLMTDYAAKTGKDLTTAAEDMGKAVMGQGRALKTVGVDFTDTGTAAGNFDQLVAGLDGTVGGFAETMGDTAAGKAKILEQSFGDIQETVGEMLLPALTTLVEIGTTVTQWLSENPAVLQAVAIALGVLTIAVIAANIAMWALAANPIVLIIMAIVIVVGLLIAAIWFLVANWDQVVAWLMQLMLGFYVWINDLITGFVGWWNGVWSGFASWIVQVWEGFISWIQQIYMAHAMWLYGIVSGIAGWWNGIWAGIGSFVSGVWNGIVSAISGAINWVVTAIQVGLGVISAGWNNVWNGLGGVVRGIWNGILGAIESGVNGAIGIINGLIGAVNSVSGVVGIQIGTIGRVGIPRLASGTVTNGPMLAMIGDNPGGREVVRSVDSYDRELRRAYDTGRGESTGDITVHLTGDPAVLEQIIDARVTRGIDDADGQAVLVSQMGKQRR